MNEILIHQEYQNSNLTITPPKLILMLYDGAIRFLKEAKEFIEKKENNSNGTTWIEYATLNLNKTQKIMFELLTNLNYKQGGEPAENLKNIYMYIIDRITEANLHKDIEKIDIILNLIAPLRDAFSDAAEKELKNNNHKINVSKKIDISKLNEKNY